MHSKTQGSRGFTLVASLLMLLLMSGMAIGLLMMVNTESRVGSHDVENSLAYRSAEGAIEQMTSNIASTYQNIQSPQVSDITNLAALQPTIPGITFPPGGYTLTPKTNANGSLAVSYGQIHGNGSNAGLYAQILPIDLAVTADRPLGDEVRMMRRVEVALIPVFQFGVFSDSDLAFFNSPKLDFAGRVHTNGDLYLGVSSGTTLTFHDKITAFGNVVRMTIPNGTAVSGNDGDVDIPTASGGCDLPSQPACRTMSTSSGVYREGSTTGGPSAGQYSGWNTISTGSAPSGYNGWILDGNYGNAGGTGVKKLSLPFVSSGAQPYEIIRRLPKQGQAATLADPSRLAYQAQIRVLLSDICTDNHMLDWNGDPAQDVVLDNNHFVVGGVDTYVATANIDSTAGKYEASDWVRPYGTAATVKQWPLITGCLTVEVQHAPPDTAWHGVTNEWLALGFARGLLPPAVAAVHPNAILMLQMLADRNGDGDTADATESIGVGGAVNRYNWFPINLYDAREGEQRDWKAGSAAPTGPPAAGTCSVGGIENAVELDMFNLRRWLKGQIGATGNQVDYATQNGYVLYFSDRRGEIPDPNVAPPTIMGEYGFEDTINSASGDAGTPDGIAEANVTVAGASRSPEDLNGNGRVDKYGAANVGDGFNAHAAVVANPTAPNPYVRVNCMTIGRKNRVTGARHALKLVDGSLGRLPDRLVANPDGTLGGFTVGSENPVYIQGDYNSSVADPMWGNPTATEPTHSAAAVIADTVTLLSNNWQDVGSTANPTKLGSFLYPFDANTTPGNRPAAPNTYYRVAIAAGKTINFPHPSFTNAGTYFGTDGGLHNFLRFLESWNGDNLYYKGSLVSLFYSTYNTGTFKCCQYMVYQPPIRNYIFDPLFSDPKNLPPATPMFRDINNLTYRQDFTPH